MVNSPHPQKPNLCRSTATLQRLAHAEICTAQTVAEAVEGVRRSV